MVELRSRTHLHSQFHSIRAIKDGSIKIVANVIARGKSKLKFRQLVDIYNQESTEDGVPVPRAVRDLENDSEMTQGSCTFGAEVNTKTDPEDFDMTLETIRKQCREKKRKLRNLGDTETASQFKVKQEYSTLQTEDEGCDVEEPLSSLKKKFSKRRKKKQECKAKCGSTSTSSAEKVDLPVFCDVKPEASLDELVICPVTRNMDLEYQTGDEGCVVEEPLSSWKTKFSKRRKKKQERKTKCGSTSTPSAEKVDLTVLCDVKPEASLDELVICPVTRDMNLDYQTEDERCDVEEPLSSLKTKFSKRRKKKQERKAKCGSTSTPSAEKVDLHVFCDVKPEASWDDSYSVPEAMDLNPTDPLLGSDKEPESTSNKELVEEIMHDFPKDTRLVLYRSPEPNSSDMGAVEEPITTLQVDEAFKDASEEFIDATKARCGLVDNIALENVLCGSVSREEGDLEVPQSSEFETIGCVKNLGYSNTSPRSEEVKEDEQSNYSKPNLDMTITGLEIVKIDAPETLAALDMNITDLEIVKADAPEMLASDISGSPPMDDGVENTEPVWENEDIANDELLEAADILQLTGCCDSMANFHLVPDESTISLEEDHQPEILQQSSSSGNVDEAGDHKPSPPDEVKTSEESDSIQQQELHSQPEKLLSGRKALSPTSQAKLRKAMEHPDSPEKKCKKSKGKLYFNSHNSHRILKAQGLASINRVEVVVPNPKQAIRKANNNTQYQRATNKFPRRDTQAAKTQPFSTGSASLQGCTQKAVEFSQGQMRDFHYVAGKLTKELKSMRQITKRCLLAESNPSIMSDCNLDEVKTLIGNAEKTEESSKKWLSIIERDCNRFCKLMGMVKEDSPATENIVEKKKKIKFADDAGGDLCHVKVFDIDLEPES